MERLGPVDASFLHLETTAVHMHIGAVAVLEGPSPGRGALTRSVESKLHRIPRYRQTVRTPALALGGPVWVDDPSFDIHFHVRRTAVPAPGGEGELCALVGRVMSQPLDRRRPLWEMWVVDGLADDRWALITKVHHCMVDGVSGAELLAVLLEDTPDQPLPAPAPWSPERQPSSAELAARALAHRLSSPAVAARSLRAAAAAPRAAAETALTTAQGALTLAGVLRPPPATSLNGPIGPQRRWAIARAELADVQRVRAAFGGTVNDVVLAVVAGALRELLLSRGEPCARPIRTLMPVSIRRADEHNRFDNRVTGLFVELPVDCADPLKRLERVKTQVARLRRAHEDAGTELLLGLSHLVPAALLALGLRAASAVDQHLVATVATNVPGPRKTLYAAGRRVLEILPYVPIAAHVRIGLAIFSYDGALAFGATGDWDESEDLDVLTRAIEDALAQLVERAAAKSYAHA